MASHYREKVNERFEAESSFWQDVYIEKSAFAVFIQDRQAAILEWVMSLNLPTSARILEVGCGAGFLSVALAKRGFSVQAIDVAEAMVELTRQQAEKDGVTDRLSAAVGDVDALAFVDQQFDLVIAVGVLAWLERADRAVMEMARVTKFQGYLIITTANPLGLAYLLDPLKNPLVRPIKEWVRSHVLSRLGWHKQSPSMAYHGKRALDTLLAQAKLVKSQERTVGFRFSFFHRQLLPHAVAIRLHRRLQSLADHRVPGFRSLGMSYQVLARKAAHSPSSAQTPAR